MGKEQTPLCKVSIVVDTNIIFSALLNSTTTCGGLIFNMDNRFELYSCSHMCYEITKHWEKVKKTSKLSGDQLHISYRRILSKLEFVKENSIPHKIWMEAEEITKKIDVDDLAFVAMTLHLDASLWTGDKALYNGLKKLNFKSVINTTELRMLWENNSAN